MKTLRDIDVSQKRVLVRVDFNVPVKDGQVEDDFRIRQALPTIAYLRKKGARILLISHLGRPDGVEEEFSLRPIARHLSALIGEPVSFFENFQAAQAMFGDVGYGEIALLENLRFERGEEEASEPFALRLAELADVYVNDAFGVSHRRHASIFILPRLLPAAAGLLLQAEVAHLQRVREDAAHPFVLVLGGAKVHSKARLVEALLDRADTVCLGGVTANSVLAARGMSVGASVVENGETASYIRSLNLPPDKVLLPLDAIVAPSPEAGSEARQVAIEDVGARDMILDIGPQTIRSFSEMIRAARLVVWNGPMGLFERDAFAAGTRELIEVLRESSAHLIVGGGDVMAAFHEAGAFDSIEYASTGGGAMLEYLAEGTLPGIEALE